MTLFTRNRQIAISDALEDLVALWRNGERLAAIAEEYALPVDVVEDVLRRAA